MADRIKGITVEIGGDTTGLKKALSGTNKEINNTQSQLKDVERLLRFDPTNTELLRQKQQLLSQAVNETSNKLDTLKIAEKQVQQQFEEGKISQQQYDGLKREIIATEQQLKKLEEQAVYSNAAMLKVGDAAGKVAAGAEKIAQKTKGLSLAAGGLIATLGGAAYSAVTAADDWNTLAKQTGFTTEELQKMSYASDLVDVSVEAVTSSAAKMKKNMMSTSSTVKEAWQTLGVSVTDTNGNLRDSTDVFYETLNALSQVENETERDTLAMALFGKGADELAGIVDDGGTALRKYGEEAKDAGLILSQDTLDSLNEVNDSIDTLKATAAGTFAEVGSEIATMLVPFVEDLGDILKSAMQWIRSLDQSQLKIIGTVLLVIAAISPVAGLISGICTGVSMLSTLLMFLAANPIVLVIAAVVGLVALIATKGDEIQAILQKVDDFMQNIFVTDWTTIFGPILGGALNGFFATVKGVWDGIMQIFNGIIDFVRGVFTGDWERAWNGIMSIFEGLFGGLEAIAKGPINAVIGLINGMIGAINWVISKVNEISFTNPFTGENVGFHFPTIENIPFLAKGGTVLKGSAIVGEAGPELLTVGAGGRTTVTPLSGDHAKAAGTTVYMDNTFYGYKPADGAACARDLNRQLGRLYT